MTFPVAFAVVVCSLEVVAVSVALWCVWRKRNKE